MFQIGHDLIFRETLFLPSYSGKCHFCHLRAQMDQIVGGFVLEIVQQFVLEAIFSYCTENRMPIRFAANSYGKSYSIDGPLLPQNNTYSDRYLHVYSNLCCGLCLFPFRPLSVLAPFRFGPFPFLPLSFSPPFRLCPFPV
jgi:hypothetical protein